MIPNAHSRASENNPTLPDDRESKQVQEPCKFIHLTITSQVTSEPVIITDEEGKLNSKDLPPIALALWKQDVTGGEQHISDQREWIPIRFPSINQRRLHDDS